ncbi:MAG: beta-lactamase family protein [Fibrobacteres bacterium]|nr:beta-lactamase family protein [Fibrobacterota bacterium]
MLRRRLLRTFLVALPFIAGCASEGLLGPPPSAHPNGIGRIGDGTLADQLELIRGNHRLPALAAVIFGPDTIFESASVGVRALGHDERIGPDDLWHIGSLTKSMTATVAAILIEQGRINWYTTLAEAFPDLPMRPEYRSVTLKDLLTNSSGMVADATRAPSWNSQSGSTQTITEQRLQLAKEYLSMKPDSPVGTYNYSNAGYIIAGTMLEKATGESWEELIQKLLFTPLAMASAGFGPPRGTGPVDQPWGHSIVDDGFAPVPPGPDADNPPAIGPAGTVHGDMADLVKYYQVHLKSGMGRQTGILSDSSFRILHTPVPGTIYACGWGVIDKAWAGGVAYQHEGSNKFWLSDIWLAPEKGFGMLVLSNGAGLRASQAEDDAIAALITRFNGEPPN